MPVVPSRALVRAVMLLLLAQLVVITVIDLPGIRPSESFMPMVDGVLQGACFVTAAILCLLRAARGGEDAALWWWIGAALSARALGFVLYLSVVRTRNPIPYPSVADAAWLLTVALLMVGLVTLARTRFHHVTLGLALDAVTGALAVAALSLTLFVDTLIARVDAPGASAVVLTNLAYPVLDIMLVVVLLGVLAGHSWRPTAPVWALTLGVIGFVVTDGVFLAQVTAGTFRPGTLLTPFTLLTNALIAFAGWLTTRPREPSRRDAVPGLLLPAVFAATSLSVLVYATAAPVPPAAIAFATAGVVVAIVRTGLAYRLVRSIAEHRREARTDELTGVANRRAFNEELVRLVTDRDPGDAASLLIVDLDGFKVVNDTLGHHNGDELLRQVASRLRDGLRDQDVLARIGGDEFAIVLDGSDAELASQVAERLRRGLRRPFPIAARQLDVSASIGIAVYPGDGTDPADLLQRADIAMYEAKVSRTGQSLYRHEHSHASLARLESVDRLRRAIAEDEIVLHYQPIVSLRTGEVSGVEALARWQHPEMGLVPPAGFLPLAESGGLMGELTAAVLRRTLADLSRWHQDGAMLSAAVNVSVTNLVDVAFPDQVARALDESGVPGGYLELELTEDLFMADPDRARQVIRALRSTGIRLVVDDYGTGYSSLGYLRDLHEISGLKLDRSFVTPLAEDPRAAAIVESTLTLARALGLTVVAEGVETEAARDALTRLGCPLAQGYLFARPVPAGELRLNAFNGVPTDRR